LTDPFDTAGLRAGVLAAWTSSPTRFREDANAEDDLVRGAYRDRLVVELAQNAADAATAAGQPGHLELRLTESTLIASNTGAPLTRAGVESLSSLRASGKSSGASAGAVGRFGVGFAAVLAVTDEPRVYSRDGGVMFSASATRDAVVGHADLEAQVAQRHGHVSVLRLPFPTDEPAQDGCTTTVELPLRGAEAHALARAALDDVDQSLLLALPGLARIRIEIDGRRRELRRDASGDEPAGAPASAGSVTITELDADAAPSTTTWLLHRGAVVVAADLLIGLTVEEARRVEWSWTWAVAVDASSAPLPLPASVPAVLHAPTPTDEPIALPALLIASFPLEASRRDVLPGVLTDAIVAGVAAGYLDLLADVAATAGSAVLPLVPGPVGHGVIDGRLRALVRAALPERTIVSAVDDPSGQRVRASALRALDVADEQLVEVVAQGYAGLVAVEWLSDRAALAALGVPIVHLPDVLEELAGVQRPPTWWRHVYEALDRLLSSGSVTTTTLEGLPVPLADGRLVRGPRGALLTAEPVQAGRLIDLGLRVIDPDAAHPLLERLGAKVADPGVVLADPAIRSRVVASLDDDDPMALARAVLGLLRDAPDAVTRHPWLRRIALPDAAGDWCAAGDLLLPDAVLTDDVDPDVLSVVDVALVEEHGRETLVAVGVVDDFAALTTHDVTLDPDLLEAQLDSDDAEPALDVDGLVEWAEFVQAFLDVETPPVASTLTVLTDLDLVRDDAWPRVLSRIAQSPLRAAVTSPTRVHLSDGRVQQVRSPAGWWLAGSALLDGRSLREYRLADADQVLRALYPAAPAVADDEFLVAAGVWASIEDLLAEPTGARELLERLLAAPADLRVRDLTAAYAALGAWAVQTRQSAWPQVPDAVRVIEADTAGRVARDDCMVVTAPHHLPMADGPHVVGIPALAALLGIAVLEPPGVLEHDGIERPLPASLARLAPDVTTYREHDDLVVDGRSLDWWIDHDGRLHAATLDGLARAIAWHCDQWSRRFEFAAMLSDPHGWDAGGESAFDG
jgi:hypothetical protein